MASLVASRRDRKLLAELLLVDRHQAPAAAWQRAENAERADLGLVDDLDDAAGIADGIISPVSSTRSSARSPTPATSPGRAFARRGDADFRHRAVGVLVPFGRGGDQLAVGVAAGDIGERDVGQGAGVMQLLRSASTRPSSASSRSMRLSSTRRSFFRLKARAISRVPILPGFSPMKARISSLLGKGGCLE